ncbi:TraR/DksA family transcriptional regulator [Trichloromonas sp.]|uniref:TraR/DksA family transcriptional regulator n=1 Tax=Trichloromonas sp. TaxID=3069249 RepID=UPI003D81553B
MEEAQLAQAKERLLKMRREVMKEVQNASAAAREMGQDGVPDIGDMSANTYSRDVLLNLSETQRQKIRDIDAALDRLAQDVYGVCVRCEEEIDQRRMEVRPFSRYCIECKTDVEKFGE